jgi:hypothetical protein
MKFKFAVTNENPVLEFLTDGFIIVLSKKKNNLIQWPYCGGSLGQYLFLKEGFAAYELEKKINDKLVFQDKVDEETISEILKILPSGSYEVIPQRVEYYNIVQCKNMSHTTFYQHDCFVMTQSIESICEDRVNYYKKLIIEGYRPKIVSLSSSLDNSADFYVIDGHHKLIAYNQLKEDPVTLNFYINYEIEQKNLIIQENLVLDLVFDLKSDLLEHIISNRPRVFYGTTKNEKEYNLNLHKYLSNTKTIENKIVNLLESEFNKNTKESNLWVKQKIEMIQESLSSKEKIYVCFKNKGKAGSTYNYQFISNKESYYQWLKNILGEDYKKRLVEY